MARYLSIMLVLTFVVLLFAGEANACWWRRWRRCCLHSSSYGGDSGVGGDVGSGGAGDGGQDGAGVGGGAGAIAQFPGTKDILKRLDQLEAKAGIKPDGTPRASDGGAAVPDPPAPLADPATSIDFRGMLDRLDRGIADDAAITRKIRAAHAQVARIQEEPRQLSDATARPQFNATVPSKEDRNTR